MADLRNFRSAYLGKVGIKGVDGTKSLDMLLKEQPLDHNKLSQFSLMFPLPAAYRPFIWKVLLDIMPPFTEVQDFVARQRGEQYNDLFEAITVMRLVSEDTPIAQKHLRMFLIEEGMLPLDDNKVKSSNAAEAFIEITNTLLEVMEEPVEIYWLTTRFYKLNEKHRDLIPQMVEHVEMHLKREEQEELIKLKKGGAEILKFHSHLVNVQAFKFLPLKKWFACSFAMVLPEASFERIWDKVIGGSSCILIFVAVALLMTLKRQLMAIANVEEMQKYLSNIPEERGDIIVTNALELWNKNGSPLTVSNITRGESPKPQILDRGQT